MVLNVTLTSHGTENSTLDLCGDTERNCECLTGDIEGLTVLCSSCSEACSLVPSWPQQNSSVHRAERATKTLLGDSTRTVLPSLSPCCTSTGTKGVRRSFLPAKYLKMRSLKVPCTQTVKGTTRRRTSKMLPRRILALLEARRKWITQLAEFSPYDGILWLKVKMEHEIFLH